MWYTLGYLFKNVKVNPGVDIGFGTYYLKPGSGLPLYKINTAF